MHLRNSAEIAATWGGACTDGSQDESVVSMLLEPRSLYMMRGAARYDYTHEIHGGSETWPVDGREVHRGRRISLMFRDFHASDLA